MTTASNSQTNLRVTWKYPLAVLPLSMEAVNKTAPHVFLKCFPGQRKTQFGKKCNY